jgi:Tfp pilus assembly protein PilX
MRSEIVGAELVGAQHPRGAAHLVILAVIVIVALVLFGVSRLRAKRISAEAEDQSASQDRSTTNGSSTEEH